MKGVGLDQKAADKARDRSIERDEEAHRRFRMAFEELMGADEPKDGATRMQALEAITRVLRETLDSEILTYVSALVGALDEGAVIDSKGQSSSGEASS